MQHLIGILVVWHYLSPWYRWYCCREQQVLLHKNQVQRQQAEAAVGGAPARARTHAHTHTHTHTHAHSALFSCRTAKAASYHLNCACRDRSSREEGRLVVFCVTQVRRKLYSPSHRDTGGPCSRLGSRGRRAQRRPGRQSCWRQRSRTSSTPMATLIDRAACEGKEGWVMGLNTRSHSPRVVCGLGQ
jgi:hypothetical protein